MRQRIRTAPWVMAQCIALDLLFAGIAGAETKYTRKTIDVKVTATDRTKKLEAKKPAAEEKKPTLTADDFMEVETKTAAIRDELIETYKEGILDVDEDDARKPHLMLRLAEAYAQNERYWHFQAMEAANKADAEADVKKKAGWVRKQKSHEEQAKKWLNEAIRAYGALAGDSKYKTYEKMDEVIYFFGFTLQQAGRGGDGRRLYQKLTKEYPDSKYCADAYVALADAYYAENNLRDAEEFYDKVLKFPQHVRYPYALYMKGWVLYNQKRPKESYGNWAKVAELTAGKQGLESLNRTAKKDAVRAYADFGEADKAYKAFQRIDPAYSQKMLEILAQLYIDYGKSDKAIYAYRELMSLDPKNPAVCEWEHWVVRAMLTIGSPKDKIEELGRLAKLYKFVAEGKILKEAALAECHDNAEATIRELTLTWHQEGDKTGNYQTLSFARQLYRLYLAHFSEATDAPMVQFYFAELLWKLAEGEKDQSVVMSRWEEACGEYGKVVDMNQVSAKLVKEAALAAVHCRYNRNALDVETERQLISTADAKDDKIPPPVDIPEHEQKLIGAFDVYLKFVTDGKDEELPRITFFRGRILWKYRHYSEAIPYFETVLTKWPEHKSAEFAANLILDSLNKTQRYDELVKWVDKLLAMQAFLEDKDDLERTLKGLKKEALLKWARKLYDDGRFYECGTGFYDIFNRYQNDDDADVILDKAGLCFDKAKSFANAITMRKLLVDKFGGDESGKGGKPTAFRAQFALGQNYAAIAEYEKAAQMFEKYASKFANDPNAPDAWSNAVFFRRGTGDDKKAIEDTDTFVKKFPDKPKETAAAAFSLASVYEKQKSYDEVVRHLKGYLAKFGAKGGIDRQIIAHAKMGQILWRQSCPVEAVNGACIKQERERASKQKSKRRSGSGEAMTQCGPGIKTTVFERRPALVKEAQGHFATALKLWKKGAAVSEVPGKDDQEKQGRTAEAVYWAAASQFYVAEEKFEKFLKIPFPANLDFDPKKPSKQADSSKRLNKWLEEKVAALAATKAQYMEIVDLQPHWGVSSAARVGQLYQSFADVIFTTEIPKFIQGDEELVDHYCSKVDERTDALEQEAVNAYGFCLDTALKLSWFNDFSRLCEKELSQIRPAEFPTAGEIRGQAESMPLTLDTHPLMSEIEK